MADGPITEKEVREANKTRREVDPATGIEVAKLVNPPLWVKRKDDSGPKMTVRVILHRDLARCHWMDGDRAQAVNIPVGDLVRTTGAVAPPGCLE